MGKHYWLHRISHEWEVSYPLFDQGYLSIGWHSFMSSDFISCVQQANYNGFEQFMAEHDEHSRSRWNLWYFSQFQIGDTVLVPLFDGECAVCEVAGRIEPLSALAPCSFQSKLGVQVEIDNFGIHQVGSESYYDIGFIVPVKEIKHLPRSFTSSNLVSRMKIRQTNASIDDLASDVDAALLAKAPISVHDTLTNALLESLHSTLMQTVTPDQMEHVVKWYMKKKGADTVTIPAKNQSGKENGADADIIAEFNDLGVIFFIHVKKHDGTTDEWSVHQIHEYELQFSDNTDDYTFISWVISTAEFSETAILEAKKLSVRLIDGHAFTQMLLDCGINDIDEAVNS